MTINQKIWASFGLLFALVGAGSTVGYLKAYQAEQASTRLVSVHLAELTASSSAREAVSLARMSAQRFLGQRGPDDAAEVKSSMVRAKKNLADLQAVSPDPAHDTATAKAGTMVDSFLELFERLGEGGREQPRQRAEFDQLALALEAQIDAIANAVARDIAVTQATTLATLGASRKTVLIVGVASIVVGVGMAVWVAFSLASLNRSIRHAAELIENGAGEIANASGQLSGTSQTLANGSSEQAASLEETSASLEEISGMTKRNAESARQAKVLAGQTRTAADTGAADMEEMKRAMAAIKGSSDDISKIIKTIDEIAFQTNILALNAAVEAARAGEAGMGFAVVAEEVRNLAQRSAQSARETAGKIEDSVKKSEHGVQICGKVAQSLGEIVGKARQVDSLIAEIAQASKEQTQGIEQVNTAVSQMDRVTQANAAGAEESAATAEELYSQANVLQESIAELRALVDATPRRAGKATTRSAFLEQSAAERPAYSPAVGVVRPGLSSESARLPRGQEKLSFSDLPDKSGSNGHRQDNGDSDHFED